jgi:hypothetical protein
MTLASSSVVWLESVKCLRTEHTSDVLKVGASNLSSKVK